MVSSKTRSRGRWSISPHLKMTAALHQLAYGYAPDVLDEYLQMSGRVGREPLHNFCKCIIDLYANVYQREPTLHDIHRLYEGYERIHGFPGMLGSIDCMHWAWTQFPVAWRGQYMRGDYSHPTIMLEAVALYDNGLGMRILVWRVQTTILIRWYYLADGIYPTWAAFLKGFSSVVDEKRSYFTKKQAGARKDVERTFGILQGRWHILQQPARS
ncbi:uncharacterized protein [Rutidosis leptorrhynchoides]|uniref:uncharacterized protein n=1 Tax=Rutidosis leptorrhynchoides TaxID=125765 RepID=UPI003A993919